MRVTFRDAKQVKILNTVNVCISEDVYLNIFSMPKLYKINLLLIFFC